MIRTTGVSRFGWVALLGVAVVAFGCSSPSYVNIPPQEGDLARGNPNAADIRDLMAAAIEATVEHERIEGAYEVVLPAGSDQQTYQQVVLDVGGGAITPDTLRDEAVPTLRVAAIRVRNRDAEVDLVRPSPTGRSAVTVFLYWYVDAGWRVDRVRPWRVDPDKLLPPPPDDIPTATPPGMPPPEPETPEAPAAPAPVDAPATE